MAANISTVAERLYYAQPSLVEFTAEVAAIRELARREGQQVWQIALDRTAFYPTSGGQPFDTGVLRATARSGAVLEVPIESVEEDDSGEVWHTTSKPLQEGTAVTGLVNAARRQDHTVQHSGQHLVSALFDREFGARTFSFHLGEEASTIDLATERIDPEQARRVERMANEVVAQALPVSIRNVGPDEAKQMLAEGRLRKLPPREGDIRLIEIPGIDLNACGGTHVGTTAEIGPVLLRGTEKVKGGTRLTFLCGQRAIGAAREDFERISALAQSLSTAPAAVARQVAKMLAESRAAAKEKAVLLGRMARLEAAAMAAKAGAEGALSVLYRSAEADAAYAKLLASSLPRETAVECAVVLTAPAEGRVSVFLAARAGVLDCGTVLRNVLAEFASRGGGSADMAQGTVSASDVDGFLERLMDMVPAPLLRAELLS